MVFGVDPFFKYCTRDNDAKHNVSVSPCMYVRTTMFIRKSFRSQYPDPRKMCRLLEFVVFVPSKRASIGFINII
jgi:hypothetical protein